MSPVPKIIHQSVANAGTAFSERSAKEAQASRRFCMRRVVLSMVDLSSRLLGYEGRLLTWRLACRNILGSAVRPLQLRGRNQDVVVN